MEGSCRIYESIEQLSHLRILVSKILWMPLNAEHEVVVLRLDSFNQAIRRKCISDEIRRKLLDALVMHAVHEE